MRSEVCRTAIITLALLFLFSIVHAGNVDPDADGHKYAWGENIGWSSFEPTLGPGVTVSATDVTGYVWAENIGWINLSPAGFGGITHDGEGNLAGYAWGENVGWISFSCENADSCATVDYSVYVDPITGEFAGEAWGENIGWINFNHTYTADYGVKTSWTDDSGDGDETHEDPNPGSDNTCFITSLFE